MPGRRRSLHFLRNGNYALSSSSPIAAAVTFRPIDKDCSRPVPVFGRAPNRTFVDREADAEAENALRRKANRPATRSEPRSACPNSTMPCVVIGGFASPSTCLLLKRCVLQFETRAGRHLSNSLSHRSSRFHAGPCAPWRLRWRSPSVQSVSDRRHLHASGTLGFSPPSCQRRVGAKSVILAHWLRLSP